MAYVRCVLLIYQTWLFKYDLHTTILKYLFRSNQRFNDLMFYKFNPYFCQL
jgi:hypothetical protein